MTSKLTPEQRLTQIEKLLESAVKLSYSNTQKIEDTRKLVEANSKAIKVQDSKIDRLTIKMAEATELFLDSLKVIRQMQAEVEGLQVENRLIMDRVCGEDTKKIPENNYLKSEKE